MTKAEMLTRIEVVTKLRELGWLMPEVNLWEDGTAIAYKFRHADCDIPGAYWEVSIEDHHDDGDWDDWFIFSSYHDPDQKDWDGHQIDTGCAVEFETMKLIMAYIDILEKERVK